MKKIPWGLVGRNCFQGVKVTGPEDGPSRQFAGRQRTTLKIVLAALFVFSHAGCAGLVGGAQPGLTVNPDVLSMANVTLGNAQTHAVTLSNTANTPLTVNRATLAGNGFKITGLSLPLRLASGQSLSFDVQFAPNSIGSNSGYISLVSDAPHSAIKVSLSGTGVAHVTPPSTTLAISVGIVPSSVNVRTGDALQFGASVSGSSNTAVTWAVNGATGGSSAYGIISPNGIYTAPNSLPNANPVTVTATSVASPSAAAYSVVMLMNPANTDNDAGESAQSSDLFVNSIGINTHLNYFDRLYGNFGLVKTELQALGVRHVRDGAQLINDGYNSLMYGRWVQLGSQGVTFDVVLDPRTSIKQVTPTILKNIIALANHFIESFEGPNELDISGITNWPQVDRSYQSDIHRSMVEALRTAPIPLMGPCMAFVKNGATIGDLSQIAEFGNLHSYPGGNPPSVIFPEQTRLAKAMYNEEKLIITETGYHNALNDFTDQPAISELAAAKYVPRLFLENFNQGILRTFLYELLDEASDPGLTNHEFHWGLVRYDGTEKPAFKALANLIQLLKDDSKSQNSLGQLNYQLSGNTDDVHHILLEKKDGRFYLILWQEVSSYDLASQTDLLVPLRTLTLTLGKPAHTAAIYEPSLQAGAIYAFENTNSFQVNVPDHPLVVELQPN